MSDVKCCRIEVEFEDGRLERSEGSDAANIWDALMSGMVMMAIHGGQYTGPKMQVIRDSEAKASTPAQPK